MKFAAIYSFIGLVWMIILIAFGNLIGVLKGKGWGIGRIIRGCIISIIIWPYHVYTVIKAYLSND